MSKIIQITQGANGMVGLDDEGHVWKLEGGNEAGETMYWRILTRTDPEAPTSNKRGQE